MKRRQGKQTTASRRVTLALLLDEHEQAAQEARVVELVMQGKTPGAAERQAARELLSGRRPE